MEGTQLTLPLGEILKLAISIGLLTALFNQGFQWLRDHRSTKGGAVYLAIRIAAILEAFALDCADCVSDTGLALQTQGDMGKAHKKLPALTSYPDEGEWKFLTAIYSLVHWHFRMNIA